MPIDKLKVMQFLIVFGTVSFIGFPVVIMATQAPLTAGVFAKTYGGDELLANKSIVLSNLLAIITVPLIILLIGV
ncbi:hypothetical protein [Clostridium sp. OS1-26]|uniref:hypothetical protein n=1 Tax=Clostridium sp. OS1-26 TaxID=3070681 RepID=UPI0027E0EA92|nr:hypothetical protein [Clostridium sp. OS1-26]WML37383.1 hypothetical protein RCG18_12650 [Clostridium sp. OS1-26]